MDADTPLDEPTPELPQCRRFRTNLALYVSREDLALSDVEIRQHLEACPGCWRELEEYRHQHRLLGEYGQLLRRSAPGGDPPLWDGLEIRLRKARSPLHGPWSPAR